MITIEEMLEDTIEREGGYINHPNDRGGPTKYGITESTLNRFQENGRGGLFSNVKDMTIGYAKQIYRSEYFKKPNLDRLENERLQVLMFDCCVLHGRGTAVRWLQRACGAKVDGFIGPKTLASVESVPSDILYKSVITRRIKYIGRIVVNDPTQLNFLNGWLNRATSFL